MHAFATLSALALTLLASPTSAQAGPESLELTGMRLRVPSTRSYPWQTVAIGVQDNAQANGAPSVGTTCVATWDVGGEGWPHGYVPCGNTTVGFAIPRYNNPNDFDIAITHRWDVTANGNTAYWERTATHTVTGEGVTCFKTPANGLSFCDYPAVVIEAGRVGQTVEFVPVGEA